MRDQELSINPEDISVQPPNIADFLSPKLMQAIDQLLLRDEGIADLQQSSEGTSDPSLGPHHPDTLGDLAVDADYFEVVSAEVAAAATRTADSWSPAVRPLERESAVSTTAKAAAFPLAAGAADALASIGETPDAAENAAPHVSAEPAAAAESAAPHVIAEDSTVNEDASEGIWWW